MKQNRLINILYHAFAIIILTVATIYSQNVFAQDFNNDSLTKKDTLVFGSNNNFPPYQYIDENGNAVGFHVDLIRAIAKEAGFNVKIKLGVWADIRKELEEDETVDISDMYFFKEREKIVDYAIPHEVEYNEIYIRKGTQGIFSIEDLIGKSVLAQSGSTVTENLKLNFPKINLVTVESEPVALKLLSEGKYEAAIISVNVGRNVLITNNITNLIEVGTPFMPRAYSFVVKKGNAEVLKEINRGLYNLKNNGEYLLIRKKWIVESEQSWLSKNSLAIGIVLAALTLLIGSWIIMLRITVKKRTKELQLSEESMRSYFEDAPLGIALINAVTGRIYKANPQFAKITGRKQKELTKLDWKSISHPDDAQEVIDNMGKLISGESTVFSIRKRCIKPDKTIVPINLTATSIKTLDSNPPMHLCMIEDISKQAEAHKTLKESEERLNLALEFNNFAVSDLNLKNNTIKRSPNHYQIFGYKTPLPEWTFEKFVEHIIPKDRSHVLNICNESLKSQIDVNFECRIQRADGAIRSLLISGKHIKNDEGISERLIDLVQDITEKKLAEEIFITNQKRLIEAERIGQIGNWSIEPATGEIIWSDGMYTIFGRDKEKVQLTYENLMSWLHPDDVDKHNDYFKLMQSFSQKDRIPEFEYRLIRPSGEMRWVKVRFEIEYDNQNNPKSFFGTLQDITDQKIIYEQLTNTLESMSDGFVSLDKNWNYTYVNKKAAEMFGRSPEDLINKHIWTEFPEGIDQPFYKTYYKVSESKEQISFEDYYQPWDKWYENKVIPTSDGIAIFFQDISSRKKNDGEINKYRIHLEELVTERTEELKTSEEALLNLVDDLNLKTKDLEVSNLALAEVNKEMETFSYSVSHDLRAPLRHIAGFTSILKESCIGKIDEKEETYIDNIISSSLQMNKLIDDLLVFSRMGRTALKKNNISMNTLVMKVLQTFVLDVKEHNIKISIDELPEAMMDEFLMVQVWSNLISNAIKFTRKTKNPEIHIGFEKDAEEDTIYFIKDNGVGFDQKYVEKAFGVFQRLHASNEFPGTGIGLATVRRIIVKHKGSVWAEGTVNKGASFFFKLPIN